MNKEQIEKLELKIEKMWELELEFNLINQLEHELKLVEVTTKTLANKERLELREVELTQLIKLLENEIY